ncbi:hypothetical protein EJ07DRAFT_158557 [Lizonia empirigonia]|nr:hypothetical protein EJ07DRAFT_158557 [Lizonia empirigonia]
MSRYSGEDQPSEWELQAARWSGDSLSISTRVPLCHVNVWVFRASLGEVEPFMILFTSMLKESADLDALSHNDGDLKRLVSKIQLKFKELSNERNVRLYSATTKQPVTDDDDLAAVVNDHINVNGLRAVKLEVRTGKPKNQDVDHSSDGGEDDESGDEKALATELQNRQRLLLQRRAADDVNSAARAVMEHCGLVEWKESLCFWGISIEAARSGQKVSVPEYWGLQHTIFVYQLVEAYLLYKSQLSSNNGGIFANFMGMGKTVSMLLKILIGHVHLLSTLRVKLPKDLVEKMTDKSGIFAAAEPVAAPSWISGWGYATQAWLNDIQTFLLPTKWCDGSIEHSLRFCDMERQGIALLPHLTSEEELEIRCRVDDQAVLDRANCQLQSRTYTVDGRQYHETVRWEMGKQTESFPGSTFRRPVPSSGRFYLIAKHSTAPRRIFDKYRTINIQLKRHIHLKKMVQVESKSLAYVAHIWGSTTYDEFHNAKSIETSIMQEYKKIRQNNKGYRWKSWAMSGTPWENGQSEVLWFISTALVDPTWQRSDNEWQCKAYEYIGGEPDKTQLTHSSRSPTNRGAQRAQEWEKMKNRSKTDAKKVIESEQFREMVEEASAISKRFILRRVLTSINPFGNTISSIRGTFEKYLYPCTDPGWTRLVSRAAGGILTSQRGSPADGYNEDIDAAFTRNELMVISTYPHVANIKAQYHGQHDNKQWPGLTSHVAAAIESGDTPNVYQTEIDRLISTSAKFRQLARICSDVLKKTIIRSIDKHGVDVSAPAKVLIVSGRPATQYITYLALKKTFGKSKVANGFGLSLTTSETRNEQVELWRKTNGPRFLVASAGVFAEAWTLCEANHVVLMEPQDRVTKQEQVMLRVYRIGQLNPTFGWILYHRHCEKELDLLKKQVFKAESKKRIQSAGSKSCTAPTAVIGDEITWDSADPIKLLIDGVD